MLTWLSANLGTLIVLAVLLIVVGLIVRKMIVDKRSGRSTCSCGGSCGSCGGNCHCH